MARPKKTVVQSPVTSFSEELQSSGPLPRDQVLRRMAEGLYIEHPELWPRDAMGITLDQWQADVMRLLFLGPKHRVAVRAGHGCGKTKLSSIITLYFLANFCPSRTAATGPTGKQTKNQYWSYLNTAWNQYIFKEVFEWQKTKMYVKGQENQELWYGTWLTSKQPRTIEGFHGPLGNGENLLWIIEEAKAVERGVFEAVYGALSSANNFLYVSSTCGTAVGPFFDCFHSQAHMWDTFHVPSTLSPRVSQEQVEMWKQQWGTDSPVYQARVLAEFPNADDMVIVSLADLERAVEHDDDDD